MQIAGDGQTCIPEKSGFTRPPRGQMSGRMAALRSVRSLAGGRASTGPLARATLALRCPPSALRCLSARASGPPATGGKSGGKESGGSKGGSNSGGGSTWVNPLAAPKGDALSKYSTDLTAMARDGALDPVIGRDEEIRRTVQVRVQPASGERERIPSEASLYAPALTIDLFHSRLLHRCSPVVVRTTLC